MDYTLLPPGRKRALCYAQSLESRRRDRHENYRPVISIIDFSFAALSQLPDVRIGLISEKLVHNSVVKTGITFCIICQEDTREGDIIRILRCKHKYHIACIDRWFIESKKCPICKVWI